MRMIDADALLKSFDLMIEQATININDCVGNPMETYGRELVKEQIKVIRDGVAEFPTINQWIPVSEGLPEPEQEVLICTKKKHYESKSGMDYWEESIITPAIYEDGTMLEVDSKWNWYDIDWAGWDEEEDCGIIPEGWWENRHFNPDEVYNNPVDKDVIAWMPLPEPWKGKKNEIHN